MVSDQTQSSRRSHGRRVIIIIRIKLIIIIIRILIIITIIILILIITITKQTRKNEEDAGRTTHVQQLKT